MRKKGKKERIKRENHKGYVVAKSFFMRAQKEQMMTREREREKERERIMFEGEQWVTFFGLGFSWRTIKFEESKRDREEEETWREGKKNKIDIRWQFEREKKEQIFGVFQLYFCSHSLFPPLSLFLFLSSSSFSFCFLFFSLYFFLLLYSFSSFAPHSSFFSPPFFHLLSVDLIYFFLHFLPPTFLF